VIRARHFIVAALLISPALWADGPSPVDPKIDGWLAQIDRSSEKGDIDTVLDLRTKLADYAASQGLSDLAARQYELLLATRPGKRSRVRFYTQLGKMRMRLNDYSRAIASFDDALHDSPKDWEANIARARAFSAIDLNQRAIESYLRCIRLKPREGGPYDELGQVYERQGFLGKALARYQQALAREPKPEIYLHMADCYVHLNNITKAIEVLGQAKSQLPSAEYDVRLGEIYQSLGDTVHACSAWEAAVNADNRRDDVRLKLSLIYDELHRPADADRLFRQLLSMYPQSPLVHYFRAMVYLERGEKELARQEALRVAALSPTEAVAHYADLLLAQIRKST
jgi:tetratricopeptide (TPR) repeat protein